MASSRDVAKRAGVSVATISRVYSFPHQVKPETRDRVLSAARELNYYPNIAARSLKSQKNNTIGIAVIDFVNPFFFQVIDKINRVLERTDYTLMIFSASENSFSGSKLYQYLNSNQLDAFLFSPYCYVEEDEQFFNSIRSYCLQLYTDYYPGLDCVAVDDEYGTYIATKHLLERGHRRVLLLTEDMESENQKMRANGYFRAYRELGLIAYPSFTIHFSAKRDNTKEIMEAIGGLRPTAIICHTEAVAIPTLSVLRAMGLQYPGDVSLILYDDRPWAEAMGISAVAQPIDYIGEAIAKRLLTALAQTPPRPVIRESIQPELILRNSVSAPPPDRV